MGDEICGLCVIEVKARVQELRQRNRRFWDPKGLKLGVLFI